ncbi:hypothetical protein BB934_01200 [Microvirga ossetica]|uniref:Uncharacterized protein n=1 Tax=Microvirga ossetica TaxID=1882682 RepID=A0A1B2EAK2_9HYPH|nr:hypothetical protein [Microvirga ossetica]ANY77003.1 hypothetical protein BB934_01200 [Microvirga ossetica]
MLDESQVSKPRRMNDEGPMLRRECTRMVRPSLHVEGDHASNYVADIEDMISQPEFLEEKDVKRLAYLARKGPVPDDSEPSGFALILTGKKWGSFVGTRRRFLQARRDQFLQTLRNRTPNISKPDY